MTYRRSRKIKLVNLKKRSAKFFKKPKPPPTEKVLRTSLICDLDNYYKSLLTMHIDIICSRLLHVIYHNGTNRIHLSSLVLEPV